MSDDFQLLMIGAMYENGGNTTHRFLDGHPGDVRVPVRVAAGHAARQRLPRPRMFPVKYRWPVFTLDATPAQDYRGDHRRGMQGSRADAARQQVPPHAVRLLRRGTRGHSTRVTSRGRDAHGANNVAAFFSATFEAWKDYKRTGEEYVYVGYSPIVTVDAEKILTDLPHAPVLHVVRNPWSAYADTKKRPVPLGLADYALAWVVNQHHALQMRVRHPARFHIVRIEDVMGDPARALDPVCQKVGVEAGESIQAPSWNGTVLTDIYPWGTIRKATPDMNRQTALELSPDERAEIPRPDDAVSRDARLQGLPLSARRVLVTGAAGFVGANLARRLLADGHTVHVLLRPGSDPWRLEDIRQHLEAHEADLADEETIVSHCARLQPEWIFHLAAYGAYASQVDARRMVRTNVLGTSNLVNAALRVGFEAFVNTGSSSEYGLKDHGPSETEAIEPNSYYAVTKASATMQCQSIARRRRAPIRTLRLYSVYGPYRGTHPLDAGAHRPRSGRRDAAARQTRSRA